MDQNSPTDLVLSVSDCRNLAAMLTRMQFNGLAEAEAGVHLAYKLRSAKPREAPAAADPK